MSAAPVLEATLAPAPANGYALLRFAGAPTPAYAKVPVSVTGLVAGSRVHVEMAGRRPVIVRRIT